MITGESVCESGRREHRLLQAVLECKMCVKVLVCVRMWKCLCVECLHVWPRLVSCCLRLLIRSHRMRGH